MIIREALSKIKSALLSIPHELFVVLVVLLVGTASFGLGRLSVEERSKSPVRLVYPGEAAGIAGRAGQDPRPSSGERNSLAAAAAAGEVVASKNGSRYHFPWCPGAKSISEKNKITYTSAAAAESAGYTLAANCK